MSWTKSAIVGYDILTLFVNRLTTDYKYCRQNMLNFTQQLEAPLSEKQKTFSGFFNGISEVFIKFRTFGKNDEYPSLVISRIINSERGDYLNV